MIDPSELDKFPDDVTVAAPEDYVDGSLPMLVPEGYYDLVITDFDVTRDRTTKAPDGKAFILQTEVAGGDLDGRAVRNLRVWFKTFLRNGVESSGVGDLIRAIDDQARWHSRADAAVLLQRAVDERKPFRVKLVWEAFDADYFAEAGGPGMVAGSAEQKTLRKLATVKGMTLFRQAVDGTYLPEVDGKSGARLEARLVIDRYVQSSRRR